MIEERARHFKVGKDIFTLSILSISVERDTIRDWPRELTPIASISIPTRIISISIEIKQNINNHEVTLDSFDNFYHKLKNVSNVLRSDDCVEYSIYPSLKSADIFYRASTTRIDLSYRIDFGQTLLDSQQYISNYVESKINLIEDFIKNIVVSDIKENNNAEKIKKELEEYKSESLLSFTEI